MNQILPNQIKIDSWDILDPDPIKLVKDLKSKEKSDGV